MDDTVYDVDACRSRRIVHIVRITLGRRIGKVKWILGGILYGWTLSAQMLIIAEPDVPATRCL